MNRTVSLVFNIFLGLGLIMLGIASYIWYSTKSFTGKATKTSGQVVDMLSERGSKGGLTFKPVVMYTDARGAQHRYIPSFSSNPPSYEAGETVTICYDPNNPDKARIAGLSEYTGAFILGGMGLVFSLIGFGYYTYLIVKRRRDNWLKHHGQQIAADFIEVKIARSVTVNNAHPFYLSCEWKDPLSKKKYRFKSNFIWYDPTPYMRDRKQVAVLIDPNNPGRYQVDISFLDKAVAMQAP